MGPGSEPKMGATVIAGQAEATVRATGAGTALGKTAKFLLKPKGPDHLRRKLLTVIVILTGFAAVLCVTALIYIKVKYAPLKSYHCSGWGLHLQRLRCFPARSAARRTPRGYSVL